MVWTLILILEVHNGGDEAVVLDGLTWTLPLAGETLSGRYGGQPLEVAAGASVAVEVSRYLPLDRLYDLREGVRSAAERTPRTISGEAPFHIGSASRITTFSVTGNWVGIMDER